MNLSKRERLDKELFSGERSSYENTLTFRFFSVYYYKLYIIVSFINYNSNRRIVFSY
jgi:hypothetical protein